MPSANARWYRLGDSAMLVLSVGDITQWSGDAIVNAANARMLGGGGVDGAIHRAAGPKLREACLQVPEVAPGVRCPTGEARITRGGRLQAKYVIHTVGPVYGEDGDGDAAPALLYSAYRSSLALAGRHRLENVAFPAENFPLYAMVGFACGLAAYTPVRHLATASDITLDRSQRDYMDNLAEKPRVLERAKEYEGGVLGYIASFHNWPQVWSTPKSVPTEHFHHERWPAPRPFNVPQAPAN